MDAFDKGMVFGVVVGGISIVYMWYISCLEDVGTSYTADVKRAITACEETLPRDQECVAVITAVVKEEGIWTTPNTH